MFLLTCSGPALGYLATPSCRGLGNVVSIPGSCSHLGIVGAISVGEGDTRVSVTILTFFQQLRSAHAFFLPRKENSHTCPRKTALDSHPHAAASFWLLLSCPSLPHSQGALSTCRGPTGITHRDAQIPQGPRLASPRESLAPRPLGSLGAWNSPLPPPGHRPRGQCTPGPGWGPAALQRLERQLPLQVGVCVSLARRSLRNVHVFVCSFFPVPVKMQPRSPLDTFAPAFCVSPGRPAPRASVQSGRRGAAAPSSGLAVALAPLPAREPAGKGPSPRRGPSLSFPPETFPPWTRRGHRCLRLSTRP